MLFYVIKREKPTLTMGDKMTPFSSLFHNEYKKNVLKLLAVMTGVSLLEASTLLEILVGDFQNQGVGNFS